MRLSGDLLRSGVARLMPGTARERGIAADRFIAGASIAKLSLERAYGTVATDDSGRPTVGQACVVVAGAGRTGMLLVSRPQSVGRDSARDSLERAACIRAAADRSRPPEIHLLQALPSPDEDWTIEALRSAGFIHAGDLAYLECDVRSSTRAHATEPSPSRLPDDIHLVPVQQDSDASLRALQQALEGSYTDTLDCPELYGLRDTTDIVASHLAVGEPHPGLWLVVLDATGPCGCVLVSLTAEPSTAELVYLGLAPAARGRGLGAKLLERVILGLSASRTQRLVCAVDRRNRPALALYARFGFREFSARAAFVFSTRNAAE